MLTLTKKSEFRKIAKKQRDSFASCGILFNKSRNIVQQILNSLEFQQASNVALYYPIKNEIDITNLLKVKNKNFYLPRCNNDEIEFVKYINNESLISGMYNIKEPIGQAIDPSILDIIYIPALMANKNNYRLGYGKGYYDRFFHNNTLKAKKIIIVPKELISSQFVEDNNDYQCDSIISA